MLNDPSVSATAKYGNRCGFDFVADKVVVVVTAMKAMRFGSLPTKFAVQVSRTVGLDKKTQGPFADAPLTKTQESATRRLVAL
jgi:hypothetical protein